MNVSMAEDVNVLLYIVCSWCLLKIRNEAVNRGFMLMALCIESMETDERCKRV